MCILCAGARRRHIIIIIAAECVKPLTERASCLNCSKFVCVCVCLYVFESVCLWVMSMFARLNIYTNTTHLHTCIHATQDHPHKRPPQRVTMSRNQFQIHICPRPLPEVCIIKTQLDQYSCVFIFAIIAGIPTINRQHTPPTSQSVTDS